MTALNTCRAISPAGGICRLEHGHTGQHEAVHEGGDVWRWANLPPTPSLPAAIREALTKYGQLCARTRVDAHAFASREAARTALEAHFLALVASRPEPHEADAIACAVKYARTGKHPPSPVQLRWAWAGVLKLFPGTPPEDTTPHE